MSEKNKVNGVPADEKFWDKCKRKARTAGNWAKTHWKGLALGAIAVGGGAYMLSRRGDTDEGEPDRGRLGSGSVDYCDEINRTFGVQEDGSDVGPTDDDDEPEDEY